MATAARGQQALTVGPWVGVRDTNDPLDDNPEQLVDALNLYITGPQGKSGIYARPGFVLGNAGVELQHSGSQNCWAYTSLSGTLYNFFVSGAKIYRAASDFSSFTDVTPTNVTINAGTLGGCKRAFLCTFADSLIFTDGVNKPWVGTNLGSTPITATNIEYLTAVTLLSRGSTDTAVASSAFAYQIPGAVATTKAAITAGTALPAGTVPIDTWAVFRVSIAAGGTITVTAGAANFTTGYSTEALAIAAVPATPANQWNMGYFTLKTHSGTTFVDGTDGLFGGASGNVASATNYYAGDAAPWCAFGPPVIYFGALVFVADMLSAVSSRTTLLWSEPNQPSLGYEQTGYSDFFNLIQDSPDAIYALGATNYALYFWRDYSIGILAGAPNTFQSTATHDYVAQNIGTQAPAALAQFGDTFFFVDRQGRPWMFRPGSPPQDIWKQMYAQFTANAAGAAYPGVTQVSAVGVVHPEFNLYLVAIWSPSPGALTRPVNLYAFDANTGVYGGRWQVTVTTGIGVTGMGVVRDNQGNSKLCVIGNNAAGGSQAGYVWVESSLTDANWQDNSVVPQIQAVTSRLGYSADVVWNARSATLITMSDAPVTVTVQTPYTASTTEGTALTPGASLDGTYRIPVGLDVRSARGMQFTVTPTTATSQWGLQRVVTYASPSRARPEDL